MQQIEEMPSLQTLHTTVADVRMSVPNEYKVYSVFSLQLGAV
jgi:hypothetical protein